ncbi:MAG: TIGR04283 family arsenosugar biosynthesis glycosyltransferase [Balneola sp.]
MISIIIPTFNEQDSISNLISFLKKHAEQGDIEVIASDGGSTDETRMLAKKAGAKVVESAMKGRGAQMNYGAAKASGDILYFLHADTYPPKTYCKDIKEALLEGYEAGCYRLSFDDKHPLLRFYSWFTRFDIDYFRFGDQSLFIKKILFEEMIGFREELIVMEDQDIVRRIKKKSRFKILSESVSTSARKYRQVGVAKLQLIFTIMFVRFYLGTPQEKLVSFYKSFIK